MKRRKTSRVVLNQIATIDALVNDAVYLVGKTLTKNTPGPLVDIYKLEIFAISGYIQSCIDVIDRVLIENTCEFCNKQIKIMDSEKFICDLVNINMFATSYPELSVFQQTGRIVCFDCAVEMFSYAKVSYANLAKESARVKFQITRAKKYNLPATLSLDEWLSILDRCKWSCSICGNPSNIAMDHAKSIANGGGTTSDNVIPMCRSCNSHKSKKSISVEAIEMFRLQDSLPIYINKFIWLKMCDIAASRKTMSISDIKALGVSYATAEKYFNILVNLPGWQEERAAVSTGSNGKPLKVARRIDTGKGVI